MIKKILLAVALSLIAWKEGSPQTPVESSPQDYNTSIQLVACGRGCGIFGGCSNGSCGSCSGGSCYISGSPVYVKPTLHLHLMNIPGGSERYRSYVRAKVRGNFYNIPVINGYLPAVTVKDSNNLWLNYGGGYVYDAEIYGGSDGYVDYSNQNASQIKPSAVKSFEGETAIKKATQDGKPGALKHPDRLSSPTIKEVENKSDSTSGPNRPSDNEIDNLLKKAHTGTSVEKTSSDEIDNLLRRPSSITTPEKDETKAFPRY